MAQGGLHREVAVCGSNPGPPVTHCTLCSAQVHHGVGISSYPTPVRARGTTTMAFGRGPDVTGGYRFCPAMQCGATVTSGLTATRPAAPGGLPGPELGGGGIKGRQHRGGGKGQRLPLRCSLRRGNGTCLQPRRLAPQELL